MAASRLAQFGHRVCLLERSIFPRHHVGESLTNGIWPILDVLGVRGSLPRDAYLETGPTLVRWAEARTERLDSRQRTNGLLVDRGNFDAFLLRTAESAGALIFQPGQAHGAVWTEAGWRVELTANNKLHEIQANFLVDASGRNGFLTRRRLKMSPGTVALCGYLPGRCCPRETMVEALRDSWCWGAPIPGGLFSVMLFLDSRTLRPFCRETLEQFWRLKLVEAELFERIARLPLVRPLSAFDASVYSASDPISPFLIRVGEASLSLDPLSSTGVEKAMQTGLIAAIALHTMIVRPGNTELCLRFYSDKHKETESTHAEWSAGVYREVKRYSELPFWNARSGTSEYRQTHQKVAKARYHLSPLAMDTTVRVSYDAQLAEEPCIVDDQIQVQTVLRHPNLDRPLAFVDGISVSRLLEVVPANPDLRRLLALWSNQVSSQSAHRIAFWLINNGILETAS